MATDVSLKILLVDSSKFFRTIEKQFLAKTPAEIFEASSGEEGLTLCRKEKPDLVYLSFDLPDMEGPEFCQKLKADFNSRKVPVVMVCDESKPEQLDASRKVGSEGVLTKPIDRHKFMEVGRNFLPTIREPRRTCLFRIEFTADTEDYVGKCLDISSGGLFIDTPEKIPVSKVIQVKFMLPGQDSKVIQCRASITWHNERPNPTKPNYPLGLGVQFIDLKLIDVDAIEKFIGR